MPKTPKNAPCHCGSGRKYKKCCMGSAQPAAPKPKPPVAKAPSKKHLQYLNRNPGGKAIQVPPKNLHDLATQRDPKWDALWKNKCSGKSAFAYTRVHTDDIQSGFTRKTPAGTLEVVEDPPVLSVMMGGMIEKLQGGARHPIVLYRQHIPDYPKFVCATDLLTLAAYRRLGITMIPAVILEPNEEDFSEVGIYYQVLHKQAEIPALLEKKTKKGKTFSTKLSNPYHGTQTIQELEDISLKDFTADDPNALFAAISEAFRALLDRLNAFHKTHPEGNHYHNTLASTLVRAIRSLQAISQVIQAGYPEQSLILARSYYELSLSLYIDWLAPSLIGPLLNMRAYLDKETMDKANEQHEQKRKEEGW